MKIIKVSDATTIPVMGDPVGAYLHMGSLYIITYQNTAPMIFSDNGLVSNENQSGGLSESTLIKAIAVSIRPELAATLAKE